MAKQKKLKLISTKIAPVLDKETTEQKLFAWYVKGDTYMKLTPHLEDIKARVEESYAHLMNNMSIHEAATAMKKKHKYSLGTAYNDVNLALRLFGDINKSNAEGIRNILYEYSMKVYKLALGVDPIDLKSANSAIGNMIKLKGLDRDDVNKPPTEDIQPQAVQLGHFVEELKMQSDPDLKGKILLILDEKHDQKVRVAEDVEDAEIVND